MDALRQARREARATLVDLNGDALDYGRKLAVANGLGERTRFVRGDVREVGQLLAARLGIRSSTVVLRRPDFVRAAA